MTPYQKQVHLHLLQLLPVRTHQPLDETRFRPRAMLRPVVYNGKRYDNCAEAARAAGCTRQTMYQKLCRGQAKYA
jgi:hypothetical protein